MLVVHGLRIWDKYELHTDCVCVYFAYPDFKFLLLLCYSSINSRVRDLKFIRNLKFATSKTVVNFLNKMFCLKIGIFQFKKPEFTVHSTNLTSIHLFY